MKHKKKSKLKLSRLAIEIVFLILIAGSFFSVFPTAFQSIPAQTQIVPSIISLLSEGFLVSLVLVALFLIITWLFGRVYCSFVCPLGGFQDIFIRWRASMFRRGERRKRFSYHKPFTRLRLDRLRRFKFGDRIRKKHKEKKPRRKYSYRKPFTRLRLLILLGVIVSVASGGLYILSFLDPYSIFGKITTYVIKPGVVVLNNSAQAILEKFEWEILSGMTFPPINLVAVIPFTVILLIIVVLSLRHGRLYCNAVCPLGTFLGIFSSRSVYKIRINTDACNSCGKCEFGCKSECIDSEQMTVDNSSCVKCFNCLTSCKRNAISYSTSKSLKGATEAAPAAAGISRREAVYSSLGLLAFGGANMLLGKKTQPEEKSSVPPTPPGSVSLNKLMLKCTSCYLCINKCPTEVIQPSSLQFGITGAFLPYMDFNAGYCEYECRECLDVCPNDAIMPFSVEEKKRIQIGTVKFMKPLCDVYKSETNCGACVEMCPTDALMLVPYKDDLELPAIQVADACIGCGACQYVCPAEPKSIVVESCKVHREAVPSKKNA